MVSFVYLRSKYYVWIKRLTFSKRKIVTSRYTSWPTFRTVADIEPPDKELLEKTDKLVPLLAWRKEKKLPTTELLK